MEDTKNYKYGNKTAIPQGTAGSSVDGNYFLYMYSNYIQNAFITAFRVAFGHEATPDKYRYSDNINESQVDIRSDFSQRLTKDNMIVVSTSNGNADMTYVGDELLRETTTSLDGVDGYLYGGMLKLGVEIKVFGRSKRDIEHLSDMVIVYLRFLFRQKFFDNNMAYTQISSSGISEIDLIDGPLKKGFENTVSTTVTSEFTNFLAKDLYETVSKLQFTIGTYY